MALAKGHSKIRSGPLSDHTKTAIYVAELLTKVCLTIKHVFSVFFNFFLKVKFTVTEVSSSKTGGNGSNSTTSQAAAASTSNSTFIIECEGLGHQRRS